MSLAVIAFSTLSVAISYAVGRVAGTREAREDIVYKLKGGAVIFQGKEVIIGEVVDYSEWVQNPVWPHVPSPIQTGTMDKSTPCELFASPSTIVEDDAGFNQHAAKVQIVGAHKAVYEHPFLSPVNAGLSPPHSTTASTPSAGSTSMAWP
jgi:hypothetical protein